MSDPNVDSLDPQAASKAFSALRSQLAAIPQERVEPARADVIKGAIAAWSVARFIQQPDVHKKFSRLPIEEFSQAHLEDLGTIALATFHAATELQSAQAQSTEAKLPVDLLQSAAEVKTRMLKVCEYHLGDNPVDNQEIADIRSGTGYIDLATDLTRLAKLYQKNKNIVKKDPKHYLASDVDDARKYSNEILKLLGDSRNENAKSWADMVARAWMLLLEVYGEVSSAGRWLFRHDESETHFPSLWSVARAGQGRPKKATEEPIAENKSEEKN